MLSNMPTWSATSRLRRLWQPYERLRSIVPLAVVETRTQSFHKPLRLVLGRILPLSVLALLTVFVLLIFLILRGNPFHRSAPQDLGLQNIGRREAIIAAFSFAWNGYYTHAFPHDEYKPLSDSPGNSRNDWGATAVDALGTAILMDMPDVVKIILAHVKSIDFHATNTSISVFESTIRYMGGLISAYELLTGPFASLNPDPESVSYLVEQAKSLGEVLSAAFVEGDSLPSGILDPHTLEGNGENGLAGAGTLVLEWTKLSELTGNATYARLAQRAEEPLLNPEPKSAEPFPGLVGTDIDIKTGQFQPSTTTWGGGADSFYEYLLKTYLYDKRSFPKYKERWIEAADSTIQYLASSPEGRPDITFLGQYDGNSGILVPESGHMACFAGGNFLLGGLAVKATKYTDFGLKLVNGCHHTYISTKTRIGPEIFMWVPSECGQTTSSWKCDDNPPSKEAANFNSKNGFWITEGSYNLRPEVIESYYYAYRVTKDEKYRDWAWDAWEAINKTTRMDYGFNYLRNVNAPNEGMGDNQESYFFSETLKYLFLIFSDDGEWHVNFNGQSAWVYSTEGHPFKVRQ